MTEFINVIWGTWTALVGWQMALWVILLFYCVMRIYDFWDNAKDLGVVKGYRKSIFGYDTHIRLWHIIRIIIDLPMAAIGLFLPILSRTLTLEIHQFKTEEEIKKEKAAAEKSLGSKKV